MDIINIKVHPPWYARGTPIVNTRDGPPMAISDKPLFAIRKGPSARGKPGECRNVLMHECLPDQQVGMNFGKERVISRLDFSRLWLTFNLAVFNTQNLAYSRKYAQTQRVDKIIENKHCISKIRQLADDKIIDEKNE